MRKERIQNKVSGSVFTLPVCAVLALILLVLPYFIDLPGCSIWKSSTLNDILSQAVSGSHPLPFLGGLGRVIAIALTTYILIELNNRNLLLRIRSRMVSSVWLVAIATIYVGNGYSTGLVLTLCMVASYYLLFRTYEQREDVTDSFHYALFLGIGCILVPHVVVCLPLFLWHQTVFLRSTTLRTFCAVLIGILFPMLLWCGYWAFIDDYTPILAWVDRLITYQELSADVYLSLGVQQAASWLLISFLGVIGTIHFLATSYNDKIQVRMLYYILVIQFVVICSFGSAQPQNLDLLLPLLTMTAAPIIAHYFALTSSWFTNALFLLNVLLFAGLAYLNMGMPMISIAELATYL